MPFGEWVQQEAKIKQREASLHSCSGLALSSSGILACINSSQAKTPYLESEYTCSIFNTTTSQRVTALKEIKQGGRWKQVAWIDQQLVAAAKNTVSIYNADRSSIQSTFTFQEPVEHIALAENKLLSMEQGKLTLWNIEQNKKPITSFFEEQLRTVSWFPRDKSCFLTGSELGGLSVWDTRAGSQPQMKGAFPGFGLRCVSGNPFFSDLWAASGDGLVSIMDIRVFSTLTSLDSHFNTVTKVLWSPSHSDMLISGSLDRYLRYWSLSKPGKCVVAESFASGVIDIDWVPSSHTGRCYAVSLSGELASLELNASLKNSLVPHYFRDDTGRDVEELIFARELAPGFEKLKQLAILRKEKKQPSQIVDLLYSCLPKSEMSSDLLRTGNSSGILFKHWGHLIPPNFDLSQVDARLIAALQSLHAQLNLQLLANKKEFTKLQKSAKEILQSFKGDKSSIDYELIIQLCKVVLSSFPGAQSKDFIQQLFTSANNDMTKLFPVAKGLFSPTIYDEQDSQVPHKSLTQKDSVLQQLNLLCECSEKNSDVGKILLESKVIFIGQQLNLSTLETLVSDSQYGMCFVLARRLQTAVQDLPFSGILDDFLQRQAIPTFENLIHECFSKRSDGVSSILLRYHKALDLIVQLKQPQIASSVPDKVNQTLNSTMSRLCKVLPDTVQLLRKTPDPNSDLSPKKQQSKEIKKIRASLQRIDPKVLQGSFEKSFLELSDTIGALASKDAKKSSKKKKKSRV